METSPNTSPAVVQAAPQFEWYRVYTTLVSVLGVLLLCYSFWEMGADVFEPVFLLFALLIIFAALSTTSVSISSSSGITYAIEGAVTLAIVPVFGIKGAVIAVAIHNIALWLFKPRDRTLWKKNLLQLGFNTGMHIVSTAVAASLFVQLIELWGTTSLLARTIPWLVMAVVDDVVNLLLFVAVIRLQVGPSFSARAFLEENKWAMPLSILTKSVGGGVLAYSAANYDWIGIAIFFLPILLSAYAFHLYVRQMQSHLDNLEQLIATRTQALQERTAELSDLNEQKDAYLAVLTHDMMTPLSNLELCTEILHDAEDLNAENLQLVQLMRRSQKMLFGMVRNILDLEKLRVGQELVLHKAPHDLNRLVKETVALISPEAKERQISLRFDNGPASLCALVDERHFQRFMLNLLSNAIKYSPPHGNVAVQLSQTNDHVVLEVIDNGYGIPAEELPYIFNRFRRVEQIKDQITGTGLGLAITKALVESHDGTITVTSEEGVGSTFTVRLPVFIYNLE